MIHIKRIDESTGLNIEKSDVSPYYTIKRLYKKPSGYEWIDEDRTFDTVDAAERFIKVNAGQGERYSTNKFQIFEERPVEMVDVDGLYESVSAQNKRLDEMKRYNGDDYRVYLVRCNGGGRDIDPNAIDDDEFMGLAENDGSVWTLDSFTEDFNNDGVPVNGASIRILPASVFGASRLVRPRFKFNSRSEDDYRVYLVSYDNPAVANERGVFEYKIDDETFMDAAEGEGDVYSLKGFQEAFNNDGLDYANKHMRIIPRKVWCTASRRAFESAGDEYLYGGVRGAAPRTAYLEGAWLKVNSGSLLFNVEKCTEENGSVTAVCGIVKQKGSGKHTIVIPEALVDGLLDGERVDCTFDGDPATVSIQGASIHSMLTKHMFDRKYTPNRTRFNSVRIGERDA